ncbi:hypothetical protein HDU77_003661 [Chytriomyces hyalinus]|nr:hypothetical protein HDU77_003661 [Chytriomyces hyalinus]
MAKASKKTGTPTRTPEAKNKLTSVKTSIAKDSASKDKSGWKAKGSLTKQKTENLIDELDASLPRLIASISKNKEKLKRESGAFGVLSRPKNEEVMRRNEERQRTEDGLEDAMKLIAMQKSPTTEKGDPFLDQDTPSNRNHLIYTIRYAIQVVVRFRATGSAPILKQSIFKITASQRFQAVIGFLRKELALGPGDSLFLYINSAFAPAPDEVVATLFKNFGTEGSLIVNYSTTAAWG